MVKDFGKFGNGWSRVLRVLWLVMICATLSVSAANRRTPVVEAVEKALPTVVNIGTEKLVQGVTTEVVGNCGFSPFPLPANPRVLIRI